MGFIYYFISYSVNELHFQNKLRVIEVCERFKTTVTLTGSVKSSSILGTIIP